MRSARRAGLPPWALAALLLLLGCVALYARGLGGAFAIDDRTFFIENDDLPNLGLAGAATVFLRATNAWGDFQPVRDLLFLLQHALFGPRTVGYHVVSLALYWTSCLLAFALARSLLSTHRDGVGGEASERPDRRAFLVAALFTAHPAHVEAVAYICGQKELLSAVFSLGSLLAFRRGFARRERRVTALSAAIVLYGLALLSKQTSIMLLLLVPLVYWLTAPEQRPSALRSAIVWSGVNVAALLWMIRSREEFQKLWGSTSALNAVPPLERVPLALKVLGAHARLAVWPHPLSFGYPFDGSRSLDANLASGAVALVLLGAAMWRFRRDAAVLFGAAAFLLFLVPVLQLHGSLNNASIYDRYLFLPVFGVALLLERVAWGACVETFRSSRAYALALAAVALVGAGLTVSYVPAFADDIAVSRNSYERYPGWSRPAFELAYSLVESGRFPEARALLATDPSLRSPPWVQPYLEGWAMLAEGRAAESIPMLRWALWLTTLRGNYPFPAIPLGRALIETDQLDEAESALQLALSREIYQPLEEYHARKLLAEIARRRLTSRGGG